MPRALKDSYVRPVMVAGEAPHPWVAVWRFRVIMLAFAAALGMIAIVFVQLLNGNYQGQDPTFEPGGSGLNQPAETATTPTATPKTTTTSTPGTPTPGTPTPGTPTPSKSGVQGGTLGGPD